LRYAIIETDIEYTWGGGDSLYFVERKMFPSANGVPISLSTGDTVNDNQSFTFDPSWNFINSYILVFIQTDLNKEIKQAAKWRIPIDVPNLTYVGHSIDDSSGDNDGRADPGETVDMIVSLYNSPPFKDATSVSATISTNDTDITLINSSSNFPDISADSTKDNSADPFSFSVSSSANVHRAQFVMNISAQPNNYSTTDTFETMIGRPDIIFVDNDGGDTHGNVEQYFTAAIESLGIIYDVASDSAIEMQFLNEYLVVVWFTGTLDVNTVTSADQTLLSNYLDGGGKLFITGQDIGHDIGGTTFYTNYLHAVYVTDDVNYYGIVGVPGDPIGGGISLTIVGGGGANNQSSPSAISKIADSDSVFKYAGTLGPCAVKYDGSYKMVYFSFGYEAINSLPSRIEVLRRILAWFGLIVGIEENQLSPAVRKPEIIVGPNPFTREIALRFFNTGKKEINLEITDISGRKVWSSSFKNIRQTVWKGVNSEGKKLPAGIYFCSVRVGTMSLKAEKLIMMK